MILFGSGGRIFVMRDTLNDSGYLFHLDTI
jgi:hypothetical protein